MGINIRYVEIEIKVDQMQVNHITDYINSHWPNFQTLIIYKKARDEYSNDLIEGVIVKIPITYEEPCIIEIPDTYKGYKLPWKRKFLIFKEIFRLIAYMIIRHVIPDIVGEKIWITGVDSDYTSLVSRTHAGRISNSIVLSKPDDIIDSLCEQYLYHLKINKPQCICFYLNNQLYVLNKDGIGMVKLERTDYPLWCTDRDNIGWAEDMFRIETETPIGSRIDAKPGGSLCRKYILLDCTKNKEGEWEIILEG